MYHNEQFLPWHRALIFELENALRHYEPDVTLPYWDWIQTQGLPGCFTKPENNPLFHSDRYTDHSGMPYPSKKDVDDTLGKSDFFKFGGGYLEGGSWRGV
jgi:hypothetical protein